MRLSRKLIYILSAALILSTSSASAFLAKNNAPDNTIISMVTTTANKNIATINKDLNIIKPAASVSAIAPTVTNNNLALEIKNIEAPAKTTSAPATSKVSTPSSTTAAKKPAATSKPIAVKPPVVSTKSTPPPAAKPAVLKPVAVAPSTKPVEVAPEVKPAPPSEPKSTKLVLGYGTYYYVGDKSSYYSLANHSSLINELATHTYSMDTNGNLVIPDANGAFPTDLVSLANSKGIKTIAAVRNEEGNKFSAALASSILNNEEAKNNLINNIINSLKANNFKGVNIDFESLNSKDRDAYTSFMQELYGKLHPMGYMITMAVPAKTFDSAKAYWTYAYDYKALANYSDQIVLMTYDEHWQSGTPGPIASINWVQQVVNYAASVIPRSKLILGLGTYGYDWKLSGGYAKSYSITGAYNTAAKYEAEIQWDDTAKVPYFMYIDSTGEDRIVYFEDSTSISYKLNIVNSSNLGGVAIWRLGLEDEKYWTTIKEKIN